MPESLPRQGLPPVLPYDKVSMVHYCNVVIGVQKVIIKLYIFGKVILHSKKSFDVYNKSFDAQKSHQRSEKVIIVGSKK
jgi:hypothetical protein